LNREMVESRIREVNDASQLLRRLLNKGYENLSIYDKLSMRYLIIQLVEAAAGICVEVFSSIYGETVEGFPECFIRLGEKGIIPRETAYSLASASRLRNLLVHRYWVIDDEKIYSSTQEGLNDFHEFIKRVREILEENPDET